MEEGLPLTTWQSMQNGGQRIETPIGMTRLLCTVSKALTRAVIRGSIPHSYRHDMAVRSEIVELQAPTTRPGIYTIYFVNDAGAGPTPMEWEKLLELAELYYGDSDTSDAYAVKIDHLHGKHSTNAQYYMSSFPSSSFGSFSRRLLLTLYSSTLLYSSSMNRLSLGTNSDCGNMVL